MSFSAFAADLPKSDDKLHYCAELLTAQSHLPSAQEMSDLIAKKNITPAQILVGIDLELAERIFATQKRSAIEQLDKRIRHWVVLKKDLIRQRYEEVRSQNQNTQKVYLGLKAQGKSQEQIQALIDSGALPKPNTVKYDESGLPQVPEVLEYPELARLIVAASKTKLGPSELEQLIVQARLEGLKLLDAYVKLHPEEKSKVPTPLLHQLLNDFKGSIEWVLAELSERLEKSLAKTEPEWDTIEKFTQAKWLEYGLRLNRDFMVFENLLDQPFYHQKIEIRTPHAQFNKEGVAELILTDHGVRAYYEPRLGTIVIESLKGVFVHPDGVFSLLLHGDGTSKSRAASLEPLIQKFIGWQWNPVAAAQPNYVSIGMEFPTFEQALAWGNHEVEFWKKKISLSSNPQMPIQLVGRSLGGTRLFANALFYGTHSESAKNLVDAYVMVSFSNPFTCDLQIQNIYQQRADGRIKGVSDASLEWSAKRFSLGLLGYLDRIGRANPNAFSHFGEKLLFLQGLTDEDAGADVLKDLLSFQKDFAPLSHVYVFENPLTKYPIPNLENVNPEVQEGTHFILTNRSNVDADEFKLLMKKQFGIEVADEDVPSLGDQNFEAAAVIAGFWDYLADSNSPKPEVQAARVRFRLLREKLCGGTSFLEWYREKNKVSPALLQEVRSRLEKGLDLTTADQRRARRFLRVERYWQAEKERSEQHWGALTH